MPPDLRKWRVREGETEQPALKSKPGKIPALQRGGAARPGAECRRPGEPGNVECEDPHVPFHAARGPPAAPSPHKTTSQGWAKEGDGRCPVSSKTCSSYSAMSYFALTKIYVGLPTNSS